MKFWDISPWPALDMYAITKWHVAYKCLYLSII